ncbi:hypothetical protein CCO03_10505 [Comamonas serinivorans]|uniref:Uncharacterized protein n=1 Tax=Comamonas serinivorans TaxID=1082851 RepID=A0A1Y0EN45_9BURK|nr:hypothetical protein [Comamonas serinivorans]ARU05063.1 hypothetical protein CCO03_10505 [Comamonas serinivorans]
MSDCIALLIAAPASGQGKTSVTAGLARLLRDRGWRVRAFKWGPDFLDPSWLATASGQPVDNLDLAMGGEHDVRERLARAAAEADVLLIESAMGLFDGARSAADLAERLALPILLVMDASHMAESFGALAAGLVRHRPGLRFAGVLANRVGSPRHAELLQRGLQAAGLQDLWLGAIGRQPLALPSRHLGLIAASDVDDADAKLARLAQAVAETELGAALPWASSGANGLRNDPLEAEALGHAGDARAQQPDAPMAPTARRLQAMPARPRPVRFGRRGAALARVLRRGGRSRPASLRTSLNRPSAAPTQRLAALARPLGAATAPGASPQPARQPLWTRWRVHIAPPAPRPLPPLLAGVRIAVAHDAAFAFVYPANLACLRQLGAEVALFSPLAGDALPPCDAVWLPGGYPELHAQALGQQQALRQQLAEHVAHGKPVWAECGGMLALAEQLHWPSRALALPLWGLLPATVTQHDRLQGLGMQAWRGPHGLLRGHGFHHASFATELVPQAHTHRLLSEATVDEQAPLEAIYRHGSIQASFFHAWFPSNPHATAALFQSPADALTDSPAATPAMAALPALSAAPST